MASKRAKESIRNLKIVKGLQVRMCCLDFEWGYYIISKNENTIFRNSFELRTVNDPNLQDEITVRAPKFDALSWLNHLLYVIYPNKVDYLNFSNIQATFEEPQFQIAMASLKELQVVSLEVFDVDKMEAVVKLVKAFEPPEHLLVYLREPISSSETVLFQEILPHKFQRLSTWVGISLNKLLLTSSVSISLTSPRLTDKDLNTFLKNWIAGATPELEFLEIHGFHGNQSTILKGISLEIAPKERKVKIRYMMPRSGGMDFQLENGIKATIFVERTFHSTQVFVIAHGSEFISFV